MYHQIGRNSSLPKNISKHIQTYPNISEYIQTHPNMYKGIPTRDMIKETNLLIYTFDYVQKYCRYVIGTRTYAIKSVLV